MRFLMKVNLPNDGANQAILDGSFASTMQAILGEIKPEAAYFVTENGQRTGYLFIHLDEPSQLPAVAEPFFLAFNAKIECSPAMNGEDLHKAGPAIEKAAKRYGKSPALAHR